MKERPILFSGDMVKAILDGRKTQTRRVMKPQPVQTQAGHWMWSGRVGKPPFRCLIPERVESGMAKDYWSPYGRAAERDLLWVKENHRLMKSECHEECGRIWYEADASGYGNAKRERLRPSIHMPRWASRITLEVGSVRVERLQDITDKDARAEGCCGVASTQWGTPNFRWLWDSINEKRGYGWAVNPWVWVVTFRKTNVPPL